MRLVIALSCIALLIGCSSSSIESRREPLAVSPVPLPDYANDRTIGRSASADEYVSAANDREFAMEQFTYVSDGLTVGAYLYRPRTVPPRALPIVVFSRGSYTRPKGFAGEMLVMAHRYARAGFLVVAPHYRGSNGWEGRDELGGADLHDLMNIVPQLQRIEGANPAQIFLAGESRGGAMVYMALRDGFPARAAAVWGAFTDLEALIAPGAAQAKFAPLIWPDLDSNRERIVESRSALRWADRINAPILIMHGGADDDIPPEQSRRMDEELTRLHKTHQFILFEDQQHVIGGRATERDAAAIEWFRRFMPVSG